MWRNYLTVGYRALLKRGTSVRINIVGLAIDDPTLAATFRHWADAGSGAYFDAQGVSLPEPKFIDEVTLAFGVADATQNYHVPLVVSPWSYSTYRGS